MAGSPQHATLVANTVTTFTFDADYGFVEVLNRDGAAEVWFTTDGTTPAANATGSHVLPAAIGALEVRAEIAGNTVVKVKSAGTPAVSVRVIT